MSFRGDEDLFGNGDTTDSLFGDDHDSLFDGPGDEQEGHSATSCSSSSDPTGCPALTSLSFPPVPDPHDALSCSHVGHTSGQHTVSAQDPSGNVWGLSMPEATNFGTEVDTRQFRDQAIDTFPVASHDHGDQADHVQVGQTTSASPIPSLSKDELMQDLEMMLEAEFAQNQDTLEHLAQARDPTQPVQPDAQPLDDARMLEEYNLLRDQAIRATTSALGTQPPNIGIPVSATEHPLANAQTWRGIRLPRRIDFDGADLNVLRPYLCLNRGDAMPVHYDRLQLPDKAGKLLLKESKMYVMLSPQAQHLKQKGRMKTDERKIMFLSAAFRLLRNEGWGAKWFGTSAQPGRSRTIVWPADSTLIVMRFAGFLYKVADQAKNRQPTATGRNRSTGWNQPSEGHSQLLPIDLTSEDGGVSGSARGFTSNSSLSLSRPTSSDGSVSQGQGSVMTFSDQDPSSRRTSLALPPYRSPAFGVAVSPPPPDFYIMEDSATPLPTSTSSANTSDQGTTKQRKGVTLAMLAKEVASLKEKRRKASEVLPVSYRLTFMDAKDKQLLRPPVTGVLADEIVKNGQVVETIRATFGRAGVPALVNIDTETGSIEVRTQDEWEGAVRSVWEHHGDGAVVQVNICV